MSDSSVNAIFSFTTSFFQNSRVPVTKTAYPLDLDGPYDLGLRNELYGTKKNRKLPITYVRLSSDMQEKKISYYVKDIFHCCYFVMPIPDEPGMAYTVGPFLTERPTETALTSMRQHLRIPSAYTEFINRYYASLALFQDYNYLEAYFQTLISSIWGADASPLQYIDRPKNQQILPVSSEPKQSEARGIDAIVERYEMEEKGLAAICEGNYQVAMKIFLNSKFTGSLDKRTSNSLRDEKNYTIVANTIYRKAVQEAHVHPFYLDQISGKFAVRIESCTSLQELDSLRREMIHQYCNLVNNHSDQLYSTTIRHVVDQIKLHLDSDLSLNSLAQMEHVNPSYLSTRFKSEVGMTLTDFVNRERINAAIHLINLQSGSMQEIGSHVGLPDATYFCRLFKRYKGLTPTEYRKKIFGR